MKFEMKLKTGIVSLLTFVFFLQFIEEQIEIPYLIRILMIFGFGMMAAFFGLLWLEIK